MSEGHDDDEEHVIGDGVDDPVVADPNTQTWATLQSAGSGRARILRQQGNGALKAMADWLVELAQGTDGGRS